MKRLWFIILPIIIFTVSCLDLFATLHFENKNIGFVEANPIAKHIWDYHGDIGLISFKLGVTLLSCVCVGISLRNKNKCWAVSVSIFGLLVCILLIGWWILWFFSATSL